MFPTSVRELSTAENPRTHQLFQNYPNPFNPSTTIRFSISFQEGSREKSHVSLVVFDLLGREVASLINEELGRGVYEVGLDATHLSGGIYFYQLQVDGYSETRRVVLLR
jgi:hypothetical protein